MFQQMQDQFPHQQRPFPQIIRRHVVRPPPEPGFRAFCHTARSESQLYEGTDAHCQHPVEQRIDIHPVELQCAVRRPAAGEHVIMKQSVKAQTFESAGFHAAFQLLLPVCAQSFVCATGSDTFIPEMMKEFPRRVFIGGKGNH